MHHTRFLINLLKTFSLVAVVLFEKSHAMSALQNEDEPLHWTPTTTIDEAVALHYGVPKDKVEGVVTLSKRVQDITDDDGILTDPSTLLRFFDAREGSLDDAEKMLRDSHAWREDFNITKLMDEFGVTSSDGSWKWEPQSERAKVASRHFYGIRLEETAKDGSPIILQRMGKADFNGIAREGMEDLMLNCFVVMLEDALRAGRRESLSRKQLVRAAFVIDAKGIGTQVLRHMSIIKTFSSVGKTYFPEITRTVTIINAPWVFTGIWKMISPLLPRASRDKVQILGSSFHSSLETHGNLEIKKFPSYLGGSGAVNICPTDPIPKDACKDLNACRGGLSSDQVKMTA